MIPKNEVEARVRELTDQRINETVAAIEKKLDGLILENNGSKYKTCCQCSVARDIWARVRDELKNKYMLGGWTVEFGEPNNNSESITMTIICS